MANKTKLIEYTFLEKCDDVNSNKTHKIIKRAIFLDPKDSESGIGFLIVKSNFGFGPHTIYLRKEGECIKSFYFGDNFDVDGFSIPGSSNADSWDEIKILSPENLLSDEYCKIFISNFQTTTSYYIAKKMIWDVFGGEL